MPPKKIYIMDWGDDVGLGQNWYKENTRKLPPEKYLEWLRADTVTDPEVVDELVEALKPFAEVSKSLREMMSPYEGGMDLDDLLILSDWLIDAEHALEKYESP